MARSILFWAAAFVFSLTQAVMAQSSQLGDEATKLLERLEQRKSDPQPLSAGPLIDLELAIDWRTDCKFAGGANSGPASAACRVRALMTARDFLLAHGALNGGQAETLADYLGLLLEQEADAQPEILGGMFVEATSNLVTRLEEGEVAVLKGRLTALGVAAEGAKSSQPPQSSVTWARPSSAAPLGGEQKAEGTSASRQTSWPNPENPAGVDLAARILKDKVLAAAGGDLENQEVLKALSALRAEIERTVSCAMRTEAIQDCQLTIALASVNSLAVSSGDSSRKTAFGPTHSRAVNEAIRPLLLSILDANKEAYAGLLLRCVKAIKSPDDKIKEDLARMRALLRSLAPPKKRDDGPAKIDVVAAFFGDIPSFHSRDSRWRWPSHKRYCWAYRAVATACHGRAACLEKSATGDAKLDIDARELCGYDPVPYADDSDKSLLVVYRCQSDVKTPIDDLAFYRVRKELRELVARAPSAKEHVAVLHPGQAAGIRCSGVSGETDGASSGASK